MSLALHLVVSIARNHCLELQVSLRARVNLPPDDVYDILIDPDNSAVFKGIKVRTLPPCTGICKVHTRASSCSSEGYAVL